MSTILVVDDMPVIREPMAASLRLAGYQTLVASNGREALEAAHAQKPDLILLDLAMPKMSGLAFLREQQQSESLRHIPVILLTAMADKRCVIEAAQLGVRAYLLKSHFSMKDLVARVEQRLAECEAVATVADDPDLQQRLARDADDADAVVEGLEDLTPEMTAAELVEHIQNSDELKSLLNGISHEGIPS